MSDKPNQPASWYAIRRKTAQAAASTGVQSAAEILIYGDIGESWWEETTSARNFVAELQALDVDAITVRINSMGGSVPDGLAIYNAMRRHRAHITTEIDGMAMSIASLIALGGDTVCMAENAIYMIHAPWTYAAGNAAELRDQADQLDTWAHAMATSYAQKTGKQEEMLALLTDGKDHYYTAAEALALGLIDSITDASPIAASARQALPQSRYRSLPAAAAQQAKSTPAADAATTPAKEETMPQSANTTAAGGGDNTPNAAATQQANPAQVLAADKERRSAIRAAFASFAAHPGVQALQQQCEDDHAVTADAAGARLLAHLGSTATPVAGKLTTTEDETDKRRSAAVTALLVRSGHATREQAQAMGSNPYRGMSLLEMARASLESAGISAKGKDKREIVSAAFTQSTSDFPVLLTDAIHRVLLASYATQALTWQRFCKRGQVSDFRAHHRFRVGSLGNLQPKNELGEYKSVAIPDGEKSSMTAATKGFIINLSREMIINDDLGAFTDQSAAMGRAAARTVEADVYALLRENSGLGPVMEDGKTLLHAAHGNVGTGAAISSAALHEFRVLMAQHMDISGNDYLDLRPAVWLGPVGLEAQAKLFNEAQYEPSTSKNALTPNVSLGLFTDIVGTPRLSGTRYYALTNPNESAAAIEVAFLDGIDTPYIEQQDAFDTDGARFKVRLDYGVAAHDWRGIATNAGA